MAVEVVGLLFQGHGECVLFLQTAIELILILTRTLDIQCALREIDRPSPPDQFFSKLTQGTIMGVSLYQFSHTGERVVPNAGLPKISSRILVTMTTVILKKMGGFKFQVQRVNDDATV